MLDSMISIMPHILPFLPYSHQPRNVPFMGHWARPWLRMELENPKSLFLPLLNPRASALPGNSTFFL
jgi:hypothetical protein